MRPLPAAAHARPFALALAACLALAGTASAQWTAINLHPQGAIRSVAQSTSGATQAGYVLLAEPFATAATWNVSAASLQYLSNASTPPGGATITAAIGSSFAGNASGNAAVWPTSSAAPITLPLGQADFSVLNGAANGQFVGFTFDFDRQPRRRACIWNSTTAQPIDLHPSIFAEIDGSQVFATNGAQQVGVLARVENRTNAFLWSGTASSWVDLTPPSAFNAAAYAICGSTQFGEADVGSFPAQRTHAASWNGTAASYLDLHPAATNFTYSTIRACDASGAVGIVAGFNAAGAYVSRASLWLGAQPTAASWVDLSVYLPAGYSSSGATGISREGNFTYISGYAINDATSSSEAFVWVQDNTPSACDSIDFNNDSLFPDDNDLIDFLSVLAGGPCSTPSCNDIDFNNDSLFPDDNDLVAFLTVLAGGNC